MPTYAYTCPGCGHQFHKFHKMTVKARPKCPECGTVAERQITGGAGFLLKGSGFYGTDYKKADKASGAEQSEKADKAGGTEQSEKADKPKADAAAPAPKDKKPASGGKGSDH